MPTSPPEATKQHTHNPETGEPTLLDRPRLETSGPSAANEGGTPELNPGEQTVPGKPFGPGVVATSSQAMIEEKKPCPPDIRI